MWKERILLLLTGVAITAVCFGLALLTDVLLGWPWMTSLAILLALAIMAVGAFAVNETGQPPTWGSGSLSIYAELSGRDVDSGRLSWLARPAGEIYAWVLLANVVPGLTLAGLIVLAII